MIEYCSTKKISTFVLALIGFSILVFFVEEYTEENEMQNEMEMKRAFYDREHKTTHISSLPNYSTEECWKYEKTETISKCIQCKEFEINAIKAEYCQATGFYDRVNCTKSNSIILRPCTAPKDARRREFHLFAIVNFAVFLVSYLVASQRKNVLDNTMYMRLPQHF